VYEPTADTSGRYDFIPGEGSAGVVIYDDKFSYSHHATDPAGGKLCNAFDLVRLHKFSEDDDKKSYKQMCEFAMTLDKVKLQDLEEKKQRAADDFSENTNWQTKLRYMPRSKCLENSVWNLMLILNNDPDFANIAFNELVGRVQITGAIPWTRPSDNKFWRDADTAQLKALIDIRYETFSSRNHDVAFTKVVEDRHFNPLRDWLDELPEWDGVVRLENLYIDFLGANNTGYVKAATRKSFVAAVARIYEPGTKFDSVVVLVGPQGCGKSTIFAKMGNEYYSDSLNLTDMKDKSGAEKLQGYWILELGELAGLKKADVEVVKAFVSRTDDIYRPSYGRTIESHPRQCIIVGTTNSETGFLRDITGNRRFWPIKVTGQSKRKSWDITREEVLQMWAEAMYLYGQGEPLYLNSQESSEALNEQIDAMESDERQGMVEEYLNTLLPDNWSHMDLYERRNFLTDNTAAKGTVQRKSVSNAEIWSECFCRNLSDLKPSDSYAIAALMTKVDGWQRTDKIRKLAIYGRQRIYERL
ncbi:virulence-associated E family protein, partial [Ruminococcus callidus]|uniref:virulence-associated E family protein n=1 Tax=Ruminococcus callidus TaxID=40519 RepID=UPI0023F829C1